MQAISRRPVRRIGRLARTAGIMLGSVGVASALVMAPASSAGASTRGKGPTLTPPAILQTGEIQFCSTLVTPPIVYYNKQHVPTGLTVDLGNAIARQFRLKPVWTKVTFTNIIPALQAGHCDVIMADLYIKPTRVKVVNFIPYMYASESVVVKKGDPHHITGMNDSLCGLKVAATFSTTAVENTQAQSKACVKAGKKPITITQFKTTIQGLDQVILGRTAAYATTTQNAGYYIAHRKGLQFGGKPYTSITVGFAVNKTSAQLETAFARAFHSIFHDHTYAKIFQKYDLSKEMLSKPLKNVNTPKEAIKVNEKVNK